jgi:hypothetical protein
MNLAIESLERFYDVKDQLADTLDGLRWQADDGCPWTEAACLMTLLT